ncbi:dehalogenase [Marmoricola endophyticus]|uniref:Dehalogenase n=1 Tax=Marmoricola endophyticus TaxID=2040280 RepID=A0A917BFD1_9ACTN|nr:haloacid dehalogenase type II [Marmoricola endophyticus]GGF41376.1 dehalogenase [Marmoricola endophyticus]
MTPPRLVVLDVNETLSDLSPLADRFVDLGAAPQSAATWFASVLRDGFALTASGRSARFADIGAALLPGLVPPQDAEAAWAHVLEGFMTLPAHDDVVPGLRALRDAGVRVVTLSNGAAAVAQALLDRTGLEDVVEATLSVEDAEAWKPGAAAYAYALERTGVRADEAMLVAVHPWDVDGARAAGLRTAWVDRAGTSYPSHFARADVEVTSLTDLAAVLST